MRQVVMVLLATLGVGVSVAWAQGPGGPPGGPFGGQQGGGREGGRDFRGPPNPLLDALDTNRDGELSAEEIEGAAAALRKLDKNKDGKLASSELMPQGMGGPGPMDRRGQAGTRRGSSTSRNANTRNRERTPPGNWDDMPPPGDREDMPPPRDGESASSRTRDSREPRDARGFGGPPGMGRYSRQSTMFDASPVAKDDAEEKLLTTLAAMSHQRTPGGANVPTSDGRILRVLAESIGAKNVVEIGTSSGHSTVWLCVALQRTGGKLTTFEIDADRAAKARENFEKAGVSDLVTLIEGDAHDKVTQLKDPIDLLFIDADKEGYLDYVKKLLPLVRPGGLIVSHNMNERQADPDYVKAITSSPKLETVFLNLETSGMGVTLKKR